MLIRLRRGWEIPERLATPEDVYLNRRKFLQAVGVTGLSAVGALLGCEHKAQTHPAPARDPRAGSPAPSATAGLYPAKRNEHFTLDRPLTDEAVAARYNNFYEFSPNKQQVSRLVNPFQTRPWQVEVRGLVK